MQSGSDDAWTSYSCRFSLSDFAGLPIQPESSYQKYRIKSVTYKFLPNKRAMTAPLPNPAGVAPFSYNPPYMDVYTVPVYDLSTFTPQTQLFAILEQPGVRKRNGLRPFSVTFRPKVQQIVQYSLIVGNTYTTRRAPSLPTTTGAATIEHFGYHIYFRQPYDSTIPPLTLIPIEDFQVEAVATIEFFGAKY